LRRSQPAPPRILLSLSDRPCQEWRLQVCPMGKIVRVRQAGSRTNKRRVDFEINSLFQECRNIWR
jgi:hypothetical protein